MPAARSSTSHRPACAAGRWPPEPKPTWTIPAVRRTANTTTVPRASEELALDVLRRAVGPVAGVPRRERDQEVAGDPAEVEVGAEVEAVLRREDGEGEVGDGVGQEARGDQGQGRAVRARRAQEQQQGHGGEHDVEDREEQGRGAGGQVVGHRVQQLGVDEHGGDHQHRAAGDQAVEGHQQLLDAATPDAGEAEQAGDGEQQGDGDAAVADRAR